jgi:hypothetical protein
LTWFQALTSGNQRLIANNDASTEVGFGDFRFVKEGLPDIYADMESATTLEQQSDTNFTGKAYYWVTNTTDTNGYLTVDWLVVHSAPWFATGRRVQAISVHWKAYLPAADNLIIPLYCNRDVVTTSTSVIDCANWNSSTIADFYGSMTSYTYDTFSSITSVSPTSPDYETISPLSGTMLLTADQYDAFQTSSAYTIMFMEGDTSDYGRVRGQMFKGHPASCIGGAVFEFHDEWWKGSKDDTFHANCHRDVHDVHSTCGRSSAGFGPDNRLNEEWFGLYNATYEDDDKDFFITLVPRPAVTTLQNLWNRSTSAAATTTARIHKQRGFLATIRTTSSTDPATYNTLFPLSFSDFSSWTWFVVFLGWLCLPDGAADFHPFCLAHPASPMGSSEKRDHQRRSIEG